MFKIINKLVLFFKEPTREFNVREVARLLKISPATASKELKTLAKKKILKERKERNLILYKADLESSSYQDLKIYYTIRKIKESGLLDTLNQYYLKPTVILYGSAVYGLDTETSDIDLLVLSEKTSYLSDIKKFERKFGRNIQLMVVKHINELKNENLINNVLNGITLQGKIKWI